MKTPEPKVIPQVEAKPIETPWGKLSASFDDTASGEKITKSYITMGTFAGHCTVKHEGKTHKIEILHDCGASITLNASNGRKFRLNVEALVNHAVDNGMLDEKLEFEKL